MYATGRKPSNTRREQDTAGPAYSANDCSTAHQSHMIDPSMDVEARWLVSVSARDTGGVAYQSVADSQVEGS
jgi:hypothetical protein